MSIHMYLPKKAFIPISFFVVILLFFVSFSSNTQAKALPASKNPSLTIPQTNSVYSTLYVIFPKQVFEQSSQTTNAYIHNPQTPYQKVMNYVDQNLYYRVTYYIEPFVQYAYAKQSITIGIRSPIASPQSFLSIRRDQKRMLTYIQSIAIPQERSILNNISNYSSR
ncbi:hypothetical protein JK635_08095 [Neobacillus sp. YIM B02564]|uniref:DUF3888 domain-containing protein n=1 Tax=Neobacillus paridis TaxID=2803862 RepID=A0ABS1TLN5_9BACI|nr:hypothetical protein [Neobacillus paridis]MBL4952172.1 hypothetical protein [Neobacillus paridis]